jgi:hypothetical protein
MDDQLKAVIASGRDQLDTASPDQAVFEIILKKLKYRKRKKRVVRILSISSLSGIAAVLLIGFFVMFFADKSDSRMLVKVSRQDTAQVNEESLADTQPSEDAEWYELDDLKDTLVRKMSVAVPSGQHRLSLASSSPSSRITAIYAAEKQKKIQKPLFDALFEVLNNDPNANVRMAALDVLSTKMSDAEIRKRLVYAMVEQDEPMVQLMMIQMFTGTGEKDFIEQLGKLIQAPETDEEVREEARFSFAQHVSSLN